MCSVYFIIFRQLYFLRLKLCRQCQQFCDATQAENDFRSGCSGRHEGDGVWTVCGAAETQSRRYIKLLWWPLLGLRWSGGIAVRFQTSDSEPDQDRCWVITLSKFRLIYELVHFTNYYCYYKLKKKLKTSGMTRETVMKQQHSVKPLQKDGPMLKQIDDFSVLVGYGCYLAAMVTKEVHACLVNPAVCSSTIDWKMYYY